MERDEELIARVRNGDREAFQVLYERYAKKIYSLSRRMVGHDDEAEEVTQEVFLQAYAKLNRFRGDSAFYTWLYRIACNTCLQHLRKRSRRRDVGPLEDMESLPETRPGSVRDPEDAAERSELNQQLESALEQLPENQRMVLVLGPIQGHSYEEMGAILGVEVRVIKGRLHRARENIRRICHRDGK